MTITQCNISIYRHVYGVCHPFYTGQDWSPARSQAKSDQPDCRIGGQSFCRPDPRLHKVASGGGDENPGRGKQPEVRPSHDAARRRWIPHQASRIIKYLGHLLYMYRLQLKKYFCEPSPSSGWRESRARPNVQRRPSRIVSSAARVGLH